MLKNVQALRAVAAMLVVLDHLSYEFTKSDPGAKTLLDGFWYIGQFGVDLFFAISGFIMVVTTWKSFGTPGAGRTFFLRRLARIYPPYLLVMLPIVIAHFWNARSRSHAQGSHADVVSSLLLLPQTHDPLLIVSWTLTFELAFYIVFGVLVAGRRAWLGPSLALWFVLELIASGLWHDARNPYLAFLGQPLPIEFIFGAAIGIAYRYGRMPGAVALGALGVLAAGAGWYVSIAPGHAVIDLSKRDLARVIQFGIPAAAIVYAAVGLELRHRSRVPAALVALGDISYATYLWHVPVVIVLASLVARTHVRGLVAESVVQLASVGAILAVSWLAYRFFERPVTTYLNGRIALAARTTDASERRGPAVAATHGSTPC